MKCDNCGLDNPADQQFCAACGSELATATEAALDSQADQPEGHTPSEPAVATLSWGDLHFPLHEGSKFSIAREGTDKCQPDLGIPSDAVSSTPVEVTVENGVVTVRDTGTSQGIRVVKYIPPGQSMTLEPGDMVMLGDVVFIIT